MQTWKFTIAALAVVCTWQAAATEIGIASFNLAWAGTSDDFQRHVQVCSTSDVKWCNTRARDSASAKKCQQAFDRAAGGAMQALLVAPCNAYKLNAQKASGGSALYADKLDGLNRTIDRLISDQYVDVIAFQEVKSDEVLKKILGIHAGEFDTCTAKHTSFQSVGFAWRRSLSSTLGRCTVYDELAIKEEPNDHNSQRTVRPGLTLELSIDGSQLAFLNLHLKSSCANLLPDGKYAPHLLTDADPACKVLNRQVAPLENWIEQLAKKVPLFVVLGDFNRKLDEEEQQKIAPDQVRLDGTDPTGENKTGPIGEVASKYLWQEISDGSPTLVQVNITTNNTDCRGFEGLDHILVSEALFSRQPEKLSSLKMPVESRADQVIETSDHCPRITHIKL